MLKENPRILIPNLFTGLNLIVGFISINFAIGGDFDRAAWLILLSVLMDKLDGTTARMFNATSQFGVEFDSFSDFFSFGVTPGILFFCYFLSAAGGQVDQIPLYVKGACAMYILFCGIRLAKFNTADKDDHEYFYGLTSTQSGAMLAAFLLIAMKYNWQILQDERFMGGMLIAHSVALVSQFKYRKFKKRKAAWLNLLQTFSFVALIGLVLVNRYPEVIYLISIAYLVVGILEVRFGKKSEEEPHAG